MLRNSSSLGGSILLAILAFHGGVVPPPPRPPEPVPIEPLRPPVRPTGPTTSGVPRPAAPPTGGNYGGPSIDSGAPTSPAPSGPKTGGPSPAPASGPATGAKGKAGTIVTGQTEAWLEWWRMNANEFLQPNRFRAAASPQTGDEFRRGSTLSDLSQRRKEVAQTLLPYLQDPHFGVRGAAALALGKIGGQEVLSELRKGLKDAHPLVRHAALLGLGASGAQEAIPLLLRIAESGSETAEQAISPWARPFAISALAVAKKRGAKGPFDSVLRSWIIGSARQESPELAAAILLYQGLCPSSSLSACALDIATNTKEPLALRCRAIESLGAEKNPEMVPKLLALHSDSRLEIRQSIALALGAIGDASAIPGLQKILETEKDEILRGFSLISMGRLGGAAAKGVLLHHLKSGSVRMRPWATLGLGLLARKQNDEDARKAIRDASVEEKNHEFQGAYLLASGIGRDRAAVSSIEIVLVQETDLWLRQLAASALAMIGGEEVHEILMQRIHKEKEASTRAMIALGLGYFGEPGDVSSIAAAMKELRQPFVQGLFAMALGFHGSEEALRAVQEIVRDPNTPNAARASAIEAIGVLLSDDPVPVIPAAARNANFQVFPDWVMELFQFTV